MPDDDLPEEIRGAPSAATVAFAQSDTTGEKLFGLPLYPLTAQRQAAATCMGMRYGYVEEADQVEFSAKNEKGDEVSITVYRQLYADVVIVCWLMTREREQIRQAQRHPDAAYEDAFDWADQNKIKLQSDGFKQASSVFFKAMNEVDESTADPKTKIAGESGNAPGPVLGPNSPPKSRKSRTTPPPTATR